MADITPLRQATRAPINWAKWSLIIIGLLFSLLLLVIPIIWIFMTAFAKGIDQVLLNLVDPDMLHAIGLTVFIALITVPVNLVFGVMMAWLVTRFKFPGRQLLLTLIDIPFAVSPVVAGLLYLLFYGSNSWFGQWLEGFDIQLMFSWPGMALVTIFVTCPFVIRELVPLMLSQVAKRMKPRCY